MSTFMNISEADIVSFEKCRNYTASVIECNDVGIQLAHAFADAGFKVIGVDRNPHTLKQVAKGNVGFERNKTLREYMQEKAFSLSVDARQAASSSDIILVAAGPVMDRTEKPDYTQLEKICQNVGMGMTKGSLVIFANTTGPGKVEGLMREILENSSGLRAGKDFGLASSPLQINSHARTPTCKTAPKSYRFVGGIDEASLDVASTVLGQITKSEIVTVGNIRTVETLNLFHKAQIATSIALANEFALLCNRLNVDVLEVTKATVQDIKPQLLLPGLVSNSVRRATRLLLAES
jgi:UDP-N-acetyl-D-glucosamine dehydrogenase